MRAASYNRVRLARSPWRFLAILTFLLVGLVAVLVMTNLLDDIASGFILASMLVMLTMPFVQGLTRGDFCLFEPVNVTAIVFLLAYPFQVVYGLAFSNYSVPSVLRYLEDPELLRRGLLYCAIGLGIYFLAYYRTPRVILQIWNHPSPNSDVHISEWRIIAVFLIGWLFRVVMIVTGNFGTFYTWSGYDPNTATLLWILSHLIWFAYILAWVTWLQTPTRRTVLVLVLALTLAEGGYHLVISASKTFLAYLFLFPIMAFSLVRRRISPVAILAFAVALVFFVFPFIANIRLLHGDWKPESGNLASQVEVAWQAAKNTVDHLHESATQDVVESTVGRWHGFQSLAVIMAEVPDQIDYLYGRDALLLPFALIPRAIFPWKPESQGGEVFSSRIYQGGAAVSPYPIGEGYLNGGLVGIIVLMAILGCLQRWYYSSFYKPREGRPFVLAAYIYLFFTMSNFDSSLIVGYVALVQNVAIVALVFFLLFRPMGTRGGEFPSPSIADRDHK